MKIMAAVKAKLGAALSAAALLVTGCALISEPPEPVAPPIDPVEHLVVAEEFGPLVYRIAPEHRARWDQVLELQDRLFERQGRAVGEDDRHRLYNSADADDDDILAETEIEDAFRKMKREYEKHLTHPS